MTGEENITQLIDQYLAGKLSPDRMKSVQQRMQEDPLFEEQVKAQQLIKDFFDRKWKKDTMDQLATLQHTFNTQHDRRKNRFLNTQKPDTRMLAIAASIALFIAVAIWHFGFPSLQPTPSLSDGIVRTFPLYEENTTDLGFGSSNAFIDSLVVNIVPTSKNPLAYQFQDTLKLFINSTSFDKSQFQLTYNREKDLYTLRINESVYVLERGFVNIKPLRKINQ